jgi:hypothetical protein
VHWKIEYVGIVHLVVAFGIVAFGIVAFGIVAFGIVAFGIVAFFFRVAFRIARICAIGIGYVIII